MCGSAFVQESKYGISIESIKEKASIGGLYKHSDVGVADHAWHIM
jgi:hypothetical protein